MEREKKPLALYIHIPFCIRKCFYCDFLSAPASSQEKDDYVNKLIEELYFWKEKCENEYALKSVFIGGGTPTCLSGEQLLKIDDAVFSCFSIQKETEFEYTVEANPGTLSKDLILCLKQMHVNRISLGLQSADDTELKQLGRIHDYDDFVKNYLSLREQGFSNINVDLMEAIPGQTLSSYQKTLDKVCRLAPEHISAYSLLIEEETPFFQMQQEGRLRLPDEETDRQMYHLTSSFLQERGYIHYEISNYAKRGKECRHNLTYWEMGEYLGVGTGASSYLQGTRFSAVSDFETYMKSSVRDVVMSEKHLVIKKEEIEEFVFLGLRKTGGISFSDFQKRFQIDFGTLYQEKLEMLFQNKLLAEDKNHGRIYLTKKGIDVSNVVLAEFLLDEFKTKIMEDSVINNFEKHEIVRSN